MVEWHVGKWGKEKKEEKRMSWSRGNKIAVLDSDTGTQGFSAFASSTYSADKGTAIAFGVKGGLMDVEARYREADSMCFGFISAALERAVRVGETDPETVEDAPELSEARKSHNAENADNALALRTIPCIR